MVLVQRLGLLVIALVATFTAPTTAHARCECRCVNGQMVPLCDRAIELPPICPPRICPLVPPRVRPIDPPRIPPIGTQECRSEQVYNHYTRQYEWEQVCR